METKKQYFIKFSILALTGTLAVYAVRGFIFNFELQKFILAVSVLLTIQGLFTLVWMLYAWNDTANTSTNTTPFKNFRKPETDFTILLPAREEENVIKDTIKALDRINYPDHLKEILILCRIDDQKTIAKAFEALNEIGKDNIRLVTFSGKIINKPYALNQGLKAAKNSVIGIFDAEDEPHPDILNVINTTMVDDKADVVQSGVQLMNYRDKWFSALNVLEYFFWFKSGLHFFNKFGQVSPLGGNTVFIRKKLLKKIGGWDDQSLTEDADVGIRLYPLGSKVKILYDGKYSTREETPSDVKSFIKQRTRWNLGFLQIVLKGHWSRLPKIRQKMVAVYILLSPFFNMFYLLYIPIGIYAAVFNKISVYLAIVSFIPFYLFVFQMLINIIGIYSFTKTYRLKFNLLLPLRILLTFYPYQLLLYYSSFRAVLRYFANNLNWEKTLHKNNHRTMKNAEIGPSAVYYNRRSYVPAENKTRNVRKNYAINFELQEV